MGKIIICETKEAKVPYIEKTLNIKLFSYEELCYYIYENIPLLSKGFITIELLNWICNELELKKLSNTLKELLEKRASNAKIFETILRHKFFYDKNEIDYFLKLYSDFDSLPEYIKLKQKADCYFKNNYYIKALDYYNKILDLEEIIKDEEFLGKIYHNKAVCLSLNMEFQKATECFVKACQLYPNLESASEYIYLLFIMKKEDKFIKQEIARIGIDIEVYSNIIEEMDKANAEIVELEDYKKLKKAKYNKENAQISQYYKILSLLIEKWKNEYNKQLI